MEVIEERLTPKPQIVKQSLRRSKSVKLKPNSLNLNKVYWIPWVLALILSVLIIVYEWLYIENECWNIQCKRFTLFISLVLSLANILVFSILFAIHCFYDNNTSIARIRFTAFSFAIICIISTFNLILSLLTFMQKTCYFTQQVPEERLIGADIFAQFSIRYDTKLSGVLHILIAIFGFMVSMAFAIIKNNYKYIKQIDFDSD